MKKFISVIAACAVMFSLVACSKPAEEPEVNEAETATGTYAIYNVTGEKVTEIYMYEAGAEEKGDNLAGEGLKNGKKIVATYDAAADATLVLEFVTEGGYTGSFDTLHIEEAPISLLSEDAAAGATMINFFVPQATGEYTIYNTTGETVSELYVYEAGSEDKGENLAGEGMADGAEILCTKDGAIDFVLVVEFTTESGYTGSFETLHNEVAPISLLSEDAAAGATMISFTKPE